MAGRLDPKSISRDHHAIQIQLGDVFWERARRRIQKGTSG
jgi:hypothetical protein